MATYRPVTSWNEVPILMDLVFAARIVGMTTDRLRRLSRKGLFPAKKIGEKEWRVSKEDLIEWVKK